MGERPTSKVDMSASVHKRDAFIAILAKKLPTTTEGEEGRSLTTTLHGTLAHYHNTAYSDPMFSETFN